MGILADLKDSLISRSIRRKKDRPADVVDSLTNDVEVRIGDEKRTKLHTLKKPCIGDAANYLGKLSDEHREQ
jgi:hypothetical protein